MGETGVISIVILSPFTARALNLSEETWVGRGGPDRSGFNGKNPHKHWEFLGSDAKRMGVRALRFGWLLRVLRSQAINPTRGAGS